MRITDLKPALDRLYEDFNYPDSAADPIQIVRRYDRGDDREVVGLVASSLAFGRVSSVLHSIARMVAIMGPRPAEYVRRFDCRLGGLRSAGLSRSLRMWRHLRSHPLNRRYGTG